VAANVAQGANTRCDHVLLIFAKLFRTYICIAEDEGTVHGRHPVSAILESIEKRWAKADQDLFIACLFLNPFIRGQLFNPNVIPLAVIIGILKRLYQRVFKVEKAPSVLIAHIMDYYTRKKQFSDASWQPEEMHNAFIDEVCKPVIPTKHVAEL
jgi:hypothetical protein